MQYHFFFVKRKKSQYSLMRAIDKNALNKTAILFVIILLSGDMLACIFYKPKQ
jgi:hypothetical protein